MKKVLLMVLSIMAVFALVGCVEITTVNKGTNTITTNKKPPKTIKPSSTQPSSTQPGTNSSTDVTSTTSPAVTYLPEELTTEDIEISFWTQMGQENLEWLKNRTAEFNEKYPNIHVTPTSVSNYNTLRDKILNSIPVDGQPNLAFCYSDHVAKYNQAGVVEQIDKYINDANWGYSKDEVADFVKGFYDEGACFGDGHIYSLPFAKSTEVIYYNKTFFDANGLTVPKTWEEFAEVSPAISAAAKKAGSGMATEGFYNLGYDSEANLFITLLEQKGIYYTTVSSTGYGTLMFNSKDAQEAIAPFKTWYDQGYFISSTMFGADSYTSDVFKTCKLAMSVGSTGGARYQLPDKTGPEDIDGNPTYLFEVECAPLLQTKDGYTNAAIQQGPNVCLFNSPDPQKNLASWIYLKFLLETENTASYSVLTGYMPVRKSALETTAMKNFLKTADIETISDYSNNTIKARALRTAIAQVDYYYTSPAFPGSSDARDAVGGILPAILTGDSVEKAFEDAYVAAQSKMPK